MTYVIIFAVIAFNPFQTAKISNRNLIMIMTKSFKIFMQFGNFWGKRQKFQCFIICKNL